MVLEVVEKTDVDGREALHFRSITRSNKFVSAFYKLNNQVDSFANPESMASLSYKIVTKKKKRIKTEKARFDYEAKKVEYEKNGAKKTIDILSPACDSLSSFYHTRTVAFVPGKEFRFPTFSGGKLLETIIKEVKREKIRVKAGTFDTIKVHTVLKEGDVFKSKGDSYIWLTDDNFRMIVKIKTKINVGHITAELASFTRGKKELFFSSSQPSFTGSTSLSSAP